MGDVLDYKTRRQARLDVRAIERYRARRNSRMDADDDTNNNGGGGSGGSHGNTKIPFGLCQREGISIDPKWTPKDAWDALAGKGYSAGEVYKTLKQTGKAAKRAEKKAPTKLEESHFPSHIMGKAHKKNIMEFAKYINDTCDDPEVTELMSLATSAGAKQYPKIDIKKTMSGEGCYVRPAYLSDGTPTGFEMVIPQMSRGETDEQKAQTVRSFVHEYTHFLDYLARDDEKSKKAFGFTNQKLNDALKEDGAKPYSEEIKKQFTDFNNGTYELAKQFKDVRDKIPGMVAKEMYGDNRPKWINRDGTIDYGEYPRTYAGLMELKQYQKIVSKAEAECDVRKRRAWRSYMNGVSTLQGLYDDMSGGVLRDRKEVRYGHGSRYFSGGDSNDIGMECLANYMALRATRPDLADMFRRDKPKAAAALDEAMAEMAKRLRG